MIGIGRAARCRIMDDGVVALGVDRMNFPPAMPPSTYMAPHPAYFPHVRTAAMNYVKHLSSLTVGFPQRCLLVKIFSLGGDCVNNPIGFALYGEYIECN